MAKYRFTSEHKINLPTIRIASIELENFKSVKHGVISFNCGKKYIPFGTQSDILGIYGQNGSGKTSAIEAISILKYLLSGKAVPDEYSDCVDIHAGYAAMSFTLDVQYPAGGNYPTNDDIRKVVYSVKIAREEKEKDDIPHIFIDNTLDDFIPSSKYRVVVFDEVLRISGTICGKKTPLKPFVDTTTKAYIGPSTKAKMLLGVLNEDKRVALGINKQIARSGSRSFIFHPQMLELYSNNSDYSPLYQLMIELRLWGSQYLFVVDSKSTGLIRLNYMLPVYIRGENVDMVPVPINKPFTIDDDGFDMLSEVFDSLSEVLKEIVPGLTVYLRNNGSTLLDDGQPGHLAELIAKRGETEIPLRGESDGVRKLISTLHFLITAYNQQSTTIAYDEFDAGIFEYLLGEILMVLQTSGKGQFIFTSHNMRPLEVLNKDSICFTTTDPENRYIKLTGIGETNNLRRVYYREIAMHDHYENLYSETKRNHIISAMRKAGGKL